MTKSNLGEVKNYVTVVITDKSGETDKQEGVSVVSVLQVDETENSLKFNTMVNGQFSHQSIICGLESHINFVIDQLKEDGVELHEIMDAISKVTSRAIFNAFTDEEKAVGLMKMLANLSK